MSPLPSHTRDRWKRRADTPPGKGTIYWHILMGQYPQVRSLAHETQSKLADFSGLHMTPLDWLHMSVLVAGTTDDITSEHTGRMLENASNSLANVAPIDITLSRLLYHPEAIMLGVEPEGALDPILHAARTSTQSVISREGTTTSGPGTWTPHMTLCYSTSSQPVEPILKKLGHKTPSCKVTVDRMSLVIQWGPERQWNWAPVGTVYLSAKPA